MAKFCIATPQQRGCGFTGLGPSCLEFECSPSVCTGSLRGPPASSRTVPGNGRRGTASGNRLPRIAASSKACDVSQVDSFRMFAFPTSQKSVDPLPGSPYGAPRSQESAWSEWTNPSRRSPPRFFFFFWRREVSVGSAQEAAIHKAGALRKRRDERDGCSALTQPSGTTRAPEEGGSCSVTVTDLLSPGKVDLSRCYHQPRNNRHVAKISHMTKRPPSHAARNKSTPRAARSRARLPSSGEKIRVQREE